MKFEKFPTKSVATILATLALAGCGESKDHKPKFQPIAVPQGTVDLGLDWVSLGDDTRHAHSFRLSARQVKGIWCGVINDELVDKNVQPAGDGTSQVNCIIDEGYYGDLTNEDIVKFDRMAVLYHGHPRHFPAGLSRNGPGGVEAPNTSILPHGNPSEAGGTASP